MFGYYLTGLGWYLAGALIVIFITTSLFYFYIYTATNSKPSWKEATTAIARSLVILIIFPLILKTVGNDKLLELLAKDNPGYADIYNYLHIFSLYCIFSLGGMSVIEKLYKTITGSDLNNEITKAVNEATNKALKYREADIKSENKLTNPIDNTLANKEQIDYLLTISSNKTPTQKLEENIPRTELLNLEKNGLIKLIFDIEQMDYLYTLTESGSSLISKHASQ
jgi:hypothetical protein